VYVESACSGDIIRAGFRFAA